MKLDLDRVSFRYRESVALDEVTLSIPSGSLVALVGENGSGKSTLLRIAARVLGVSSGEARLDGRPLRAWQPKEYAQSVGYLPQEPELPFSMRALDVVVSGRAPFLGRFGWENDDDYRIAGEALATCDASHLSERDLEEMSGGERKRVFLARVLAGQPRLVLLDEPLAALDLAHVQAVSQLLRDIVTRTGATVVFASHDLNWAAAYADRMIVMHRGRAVLDAAPSEVMKPETMAKYFGVQANAVTSGTATWIVPDV